MYTFETELLQKWPYSKAVKCQVYADAACSGRWSCYLKKAIPAEAPHLHPPLVSADDDVMLVQSRVNRQHDFGNETRIGHYSQAFTARPLPRPVPGTWKLSLLKHVKFI
jgi:hypothetical protein